MEGWATASHQGANQLGATAASRRPLLLLVAALAAALPAGAAFASPPRAAAALRADRAGARGAQCAVAVGASAGGQNPCVRICRYKAAVADGQVCIGCFRDQYEIANWSKLSEQDRKLALQDVADRRAEWGDVDDVAKARDEL
ncbi:hypothetical protein T484DRAFT_1952165 [Baffinella frigidus]|nr:hypothetical protein T484DRAFT_1952165 [Cryptophyta sp. CCMP2293]|mmetsp:Transcript_44737/g.106653  ORF Transcript_44737/g.106653 Transcript_44737/m.106653 type:complete len:143 (+) Transcript_44737:63-491(+)